LQRSLQNGNSALASESVGFLQIGQRCFIRRGYRKVRGATPSLHLSEDWERRRCRELLTAD
jgi:hypothetical protein